MSELTLRFGEARLHVEGDADLVARERAAFLSQYGQSTLSYRVQPH